MPSCENEGNDDDADLAAEQADRAAERHQEMVEEDSPCEDVFTQMNAVNGALHRMSFLLAGVVSVLLPHMWVVGVIGRARRPTRRR